MSAQPRLTIAVCTRNRHDLLAQCLRSLDVEISADDIEVLVVDNGSEDRTPELLEGWQDGGRRRVAVESTVGLSAARNRALRDSRAPIVAFIDDDATVAPGYAEAVLAPFARKRVVAVGGRVELAFERGSAPTWASDSLQRYWSRFDRGADPGPIKAPQSPYGCNVAVDRAEALEAGGFDPRLGYRDSGLISGEEAELVARMRRQGGRAWYAPDAVVHHHVGADRARLGWVLRRAWSQGRAEIRRSQLGDSRGPLGVKANARSVARTVAHSRPSRSGSANVDQLARLATRLGALDETLRARAGAGGRSRSGRAAGSSVTLEDLERRIERLERSHRHVHGPMLTELADDVRALRDAES